MNHKNNTGGFLKYIIIIIIAIILLNFFGLTFRGAVDWFINAVRSVF